jgi:hypothetical protein
MDPVIAEEHWNLRLYVAGQTDKSIRAIRNLNRICAEHLNGHYTIEVIDLMDRPQLVSGRSDYDGLVYAENGQLLWRDEQLDAASDAGLLLDQSELVEGLEHLVD